MVRVNLTTSLPADVADRLKSYAKLNGVRMNAIIEEGIALSMAGGALPDDLEKALQAFATANGMGRNDVLELALSRFLRERKDAD